MKKALCVLLAAMMSASLAACGDKENTGDSGSANSAGKTLRVTWNGDGDNRDKLLSCLEDYQKETGNTVEFTFVAGNWGEYFTKIQTMIAGGESLDCIFAAIEGFQMYVDMGLAMPLTDYAEEHKEEVDELMADVPDGLEIPLHRRCAVWVPAGI